MGFPTAPLSPCPRSGRFMPDKHINRLKAEIELVLATLPEHMKELDGITPALPELGVKTPCRVAA